MYLNSITVTLILLSYPASTVISIINVLLFYYRDRYRSISIFEIEPPPQAGPSGPSRRCASAGAYHPHAAAGLRTGPSRTPRGGCDLSPVVRRRCTASLRRTSLAGSPSRSTLTESSLLVSQRTQCQWQWWPTLPLALGQLYNADAGRYR